MLKYFKESAISVEQAEKMSPEELDTRITVGEFARRERPTLVESVYAMMKEARDSAEQD
jgi:hypothetical protein